MGFMNGRYGADQLGRFLSFVALILLIVNLFVRFWPLYLVCVVLIVIDFYRMFSRDIARRSEENRKFLNFVYGLKRKFTAGKNRMNDKEHCYFKCPRCQKRLRVPKGKGTISIHCPQCGTDFIKRT